MNYLEYEIQKETERVKEAQRLHGYDQTCVICGEPNQRCLELHHLPERGYGDDLVPVCRNCHRKLTDKSNNKPVPPDPSRMERIAHWLLALALFLLELARKAFEYGTTLLEAAKMLPAPLGTLGVAQ